MSMYYVSLQQLHLNIRNYFTYRSVTIFSVPPYRNSFSQLFLRYTNNISTLKEMQTSPIQIFKCDIFDLNIQWTQMYSNTYMHIILKRREKVIMCRKYCREENYKSRYQEKETLNFGIKFTLHLNGRLQEELYELEESWVQEFLLILA